jgi:uncharacterized protein (DUF1015 family)
MTEITPFRGLRYDPAAVSGSDVIAPPYDVVGPAEVAALLGRSPYNVAHVESVPGTGDDRYAAAADALRSWEAAGVLRRDASPCYYAYEQRFAVPGETRTVTRRVFFARMRLSPREEGIVRPHEATLSAAKEDRLRLLRATHTNVSPIFAMFADPTGAASRILEQVAAGTPALEATDGRGDSHRLWVIDDPTQVDALTRAVAASPATIADGHHRYETALNYLREREAANDVVEADRYLLTGLVAQEEPGLIVLPIHRLIRAGAVPADLVAQIERLYTLEDVGASDSEEDAERLWARVRTAEAAVPTFGAIGLLPGRMHLLVARQPAVAEAMPAGLSDASKSLDVLVLNNTVLEPMMGLDTAARAAGEHIAFSEAITEAWHGVQSGEFRIAFLVRPVRVAEIVAIADAGELLPQKSTFFYPKLATGMVLNRLD